MPWLGYSEGFWSNGKMQREKDNWNKRKFEEVTSTLPRTRECLVYTTNVRKLASGQEKNVALFGRGRSTRQKHRQVVMKSERGIPRRNEMLPKLMKSAFVWWKYGVEFPFASPLCARNQAEPTLTGAFVVRSEC
jgi:hypothetical protein